MLLPATQARLTSLIGGDYYVSLLYHDVAIIHSGKDMNINQLQDSIDSAAITSPYGTLSRYPLKYDAMRKVLKVIRG